MTRGGGPRAGPWPTGARASPARPTTPRSPPWAAAPSPRCSPTRTTDPDRARSPGRFTSGRGRWGPSVALEDGHPVGDRGAGEEGGDRAVGGAGDRRAGGVVER